MQFSVPGEHAEWHAYLPDVQRHTRKLAQRYGVRYAAGRPAGSPGLAVAGTGAAGGRAGQAGRHRDLLPA